VTQRQRVLAYLMYQDSVCVGDLPVELSYTLRNRVSELRRDGHQISSERCRRHDHAGPVYRYRLIRQPVQQVMAV
jgi:hypothetical protein